MTPYDRAVSKALKEQYGAKPVSTDKSAVRGAQGRDRASTKGVTDGLSDLEVMFDTLLDQCAPDLPKPQGYRGGEQFQPVPDRGFKADRFFGPTLIVEVQGTGHERIDWNARRSGKGQLGKYDRDIEKHNLYTLHGYRLLQVTAFMLETDPDSFFNLLREVLNGRND